METIRERAYIAVGHPLPPKGAMHVPDNKLELCEQTFVNGYIQGASTQLHLDMQKMCRFLEAYHNGPVGEKEYLVYKFREYMIDGND